MSSNGGSLIIENGSLITSGQIIDDGMVAIHEGKIVYAGSRRPVDSAWFSNPPARETGAGSISINNNINRFDAGRGWICPGLLDVHLHGGGGADVMDASIEALHTIAKAHTRHGTTGFLAGTVTASHQELLPVAEVIRQAVAAGANSFASTPASSASSTTSTPDWQAAAVLGLHLEGPYLSYNRRGAHNAAHLRPPSKEELAELLAILGAHFRMITLAPELENALEIIPWLVQHDVTVSLGHSEAPYELALKAIAAGARHATHTYNGMNALHHRDPGLLTAVLLEDRLTAELIADGIHVHPAVLRLAWKLKGTERTCLVTDAIGAMGMPPGLYNLGGLEVEVVGNTCRLIEGGSLAGSVLGMDIAVKNMVEMVGVPLREAVYMATAVPARQMGLAHCKGALAPGMDGDICVLGQDLLCSATIIAGRPVYRAG
ncbi:MAG TPA: N-acetylglucosamine-6-phosphate deacetylase [Firmicutes bacterium]|nr:N-acetylglucosamine-6-phosphate deacetylase [Bacillota bacterium]